MQDTLIQYFDGREHGLKSACASSKGSLYLLYDGKLEELFPDGTVKTLCDASKGLRGIKRVVEGKDALFISDSDGVKTLRDGRVETITGSTQELCVAALENGGFITLEGTHNPTLRVRNGRTVVDQRLLSDCVMTEEKSKDLLCEFESKVFLKNTMIGSLCLVEGGGKALDAKDFMHPRWRNCGIAISVTVVGKDVYHIALSEKDGQPNLYKNCTLLDQLDLQYDTLPRVTAHPESGVFVVEDGNVRKLATTLPAVCQ